MDYAPMLANFHLMTSVWLPALTTAGFAAREKARLVVLHDATFTAQVATNWSVATPASTPAEPTPAFEKVAAAQVTLLETHVAPAPDEVNESASGVIVIASCLVAVASAMLSTVTEAAAALVIAEVLVTANVMPAGTVTRACSLTVAVRVVVWLESGNDTAVCAEATPAESAAMATMTAVRTNTFFIVFLSSAVEPRY
ncbi:MAG: hypothetical protein ABI868_18140 [Acidobacteriota bacterium]